MTTTAARPAIRHSHPYPAVREVHAASCERIESVRAAGGIELVDYLDQRAEHYSAENAEALVDCLGDNITEERRIELRASSAAIVLECARTAAHVLGLDAHRLAPSDMVALLDYYRRLRLLA